GRVVTAADAAPVAGSRVLLSQPGAPPSPLGGDAPVGFTTAGAAGEFTLSGVAAGAYRLLATADGYANRTAAIQVDDGSDLEGLQVALSAARGLTLRVTGADGAPVAGIAAALLDASGSVVVAGQYPAGEGGRVRILEAPAGRYRLLVAGAPGFASVNLDVTVPGDEVPLTLPPSCRLSVHLAAGSGTGEMQMLTVTGADGRAFTAWGFFGPVESWPLEDGHVTVDALPPGAWSLTVTSAGRAFRGQATTTAGGTVEVTLR